MLIVVLILTIVVVVIDASLKSRSPAPAQTLSAQAWVDRVLPVVATSTSEGAQLQHLRTDGLGTPATQISAELRAVSAGAAAAYRQVAGLGEPTAAGGAPGLLEAALLVRAQAAAAVASAYGAALSSPSPPASASDPAVQALAAAGTKLVVGDQAYQLFAADLPRSLGVAMPPSVWAPDPSLYQAPSLQVFLVALRNGTNLQPVHQVAVEAVSTAPPPVGVASGIQDIPPTRYLTVTVVVADTGNQPERDLTVTAALTPVAAGAAPSVRAFVSLAPGTAQATTIGPLAPAPGVPATLTVTVTPPAGSPTPVATTTLQVEVGAAPPPSTTTTVPATSTTTTGGRSGG